MIPDALKPLKKDSRHFSLGAIYTLPKLEELPKEFSIDSLSIKNQGADNNIDFCAACAGTVIKEPQEKTILYYPYLFAAAKYESGDDIDSFGLDLSAIGKALVKWGIPELKDVSDDILNLDTQARRRFENYPQELRDKASKHKAQSYFFVDGPYDPYDNAKAALYKFGTGIEFGVMFGWQLSDFILDGTPKGGGHALANTGFYEDGLKIKNSYGENAGQGGFHKMTRKTFNYYAKKYGMMMFLDMPEFLEKEDIQKLSRYYRAGFFEKILIFIKNFLFIK